MKGSFKPDMDIFIKTSPEELTRVFQSLGFEVEKKRTYYSAVRKARGGRLHGAFIQRDGHIYCDFHFDRTVHFLLFGVDYGRRPKNFFYAKLRRELIDRRIDFRANQVSWFSRRNKAIFRGFRV